MFNTNKDKNILLLISFAVINFQLITAQEFPINDNTKKITYTEVVQLSDSTISKEKLYTITREWFAKTFKSSNKVLQMEDKESGKLIGKGNIPIKMTKYLTPSHVDFTISVYFKDGKYKYVITDFNHISDKSGYSGGFLENEKPDCGKWKMMNKGWIQIKNQTIVAVENLISDLQNNLNNPENEDDW